MFGDCNESDFNFCILNLMRHSGVASRSKWKFVKFQIKLGDQHPASCTKLSTWCIAFIDSLSSFVASPGRAAGDRLNLM